MARIVTSIHDPAAIAETCRELGLDLPDERDVHLDTQPVFGHAVRLPGLRFPAVFDILTGLVAYHPSDNTFGRFDRLMRFILKVYAVQARTRWIGTSFRVQDDYQLLPVPQAA